MQNVGFNNEDDKKFVIFFCELISHMMVFSQFSKRKHQKVPKMKKLCINIPKSKQSTESIHVAPNEVAPLANMFRSHVINV